MLTEDNSLQKDIVASFYLQGISVKVCGDLPPAGALPCVTTRWRSVTGKSAV